MGTTLAYYLDALLKNDEKVLKQLYLETIPSVKTYILKNSGTETDAQDIFQEALLAIFQKAQSGKLQINGDFQPYLFAVCRNLWLMQLRKKSQKGVTSMDERQHMIMIDSFGEAEQTANQYARLRLLEEQLQQLGEGCSNLLKLAWSGKPLEEVAKLLNNSYAYIRKKKSECMGKLLVLVKNTPEYKQLKW
jgi:RNA polymerase sigma factor (sigma-70 family)